MEECPLLLPGTEGDKSPSLSLVYKVLKTATLAALYICFGIFSEITGPTIPELAAQTHSQYHVITFAISMRGAGNALGGIIGGLTVDKWLQHLDIVAAAATFIYTCLSVTAAYVQSVGYLFLIFYLQGSIEMWQQTAASRTILVIWRDKSAGALHALHAGYGLGSIVASVVISSFLDPKFSDETFTTDNRGLWTENCISHKNQTEWTTPQYPARFVTAYWILSTVGAALTLTFITHHIYGLVTSTTIDHAPMHKTKNSQPVRHSLSLRNCSPKHPKYAATVIFCLFLYYFIAVPLNRAFVKLLFSYAREGPRMSVSDATGLVTGYFTAMTVGRMCVFLASTVIHMKYILQVEMIGMFTCTLTLFLYEEDVTLLWVFCIALGFFTGPTIPSAYAWANRYIEVTSTAQILPQIGAAIGDMIFMLGVGYSYEQYGPDVVWSYQLCLILALWLLTVIMQIVGSKHGDRYNVDLRAS